MEDLTFRRATYHFCYTSTGPNSVLQPHLTTEEAGNVTVEMGFVYRCTAIPYCDNWPLFYLKKNFILSTCLAQNIKFRLQLLQSNINSHLNFTKLISHYTLQRPSFSTKLIYFLFTSPITMPFIGHFNLLHLNILPSFSINT